MLATKGHMVCVPFFNKNRTPPHTHPIRPQVISFAVSMKQMWVKSHHPSLLWVQTW